MNNITKSYIKDIQQAISENRLVIFAGAGTSCDAGVPMWNDLVMNLASIFPETLCEENKHDLLRLAQLFRETCDDKAYYDRVKSELTSNIKAPNAIHSSIFELNPCNIITTNYDTLFEDASLRNNRQYYLVSKDSDLPINHGERMIVKMHGDLVNNNIVLTENDYYDYSRNFPLIRSFVISQFVSKVVLFVGFSFNDINLKYILREIKSVLGSKMQRVYMLTDNIPSEWIARNQELNGVNILSINNDDAQEIINSLAIDTPDVSILSKQCKTLVNQLLLIKGYREEKNLVEIGIDFAKTHEKYITTFREYLKYAFPDNKRDGFYLSGIRLTLPNAYDKEFKSYISNKHCFYELVNKYGVEELQHLRFFLINNGILEIDGINLFSKTAYRKLCSDTFGRALNAYYNVDQIGLARELSRLRSQDLTYTINDLELPYVLFLIGHFYEAYQIYCRLATEMWRRKKYALFFLCIFNKHHITYPAYYELASRKDINKENIIREWRKTDLMKELSLLPLSDCVRNMFADMIFSKFLANDALQTSKLQIEIAEHRRKACEHSYWSTNNYVGSIINNYWSTFTMCNNNYIISDNNTQGSQIYVAAARGIFNSLMIPDEPNQSRLPYLYKQTIFLLIFKLSNDTLKGIIKDICTDKEIEAEEDVVEFLKTCVAHQNDVLELKREKFNNTQVIDLKVLANNFRNILLLSNTIKNCPKLEGFDELFAEYWDDWSLHTCIDDVRKYLFRHSPTIDIAKKLISKCLYSFRSEIELLPLLNLLPQAIQQVNQIWDDSRYLSLIEFQGSTDIAACLLKVLPEDKKAIVLQWIWSHITSLVQLVFFDLFSSEKHLNTDTFEKFKDKLFLEKQCKDGKILFPQLTFFYELPQYADIKKQIEELSDSNPLLKYLLDPVNWIYTETFDKTWFDCLLSQENVIAEIAKNPVARNLLKEYSETCSWRKKLNQILWNTI